MNKVVSEHDRRVLVIGGGCVVLIMLFGLVVGPWLDGWSQMRAQLAAVEGKFERAGLGDSAAVRAKQAALIAKVPAFELPVSLQQQRLLFERRVDKQLKAAGLTVKSIQYAGKPKVDPQAGYKMLKLNCRGAKCNWGQLLDLLAGLDENLYLVSVEDIQIRCNQQNRNEIELVSLTLSSYTN